jgi:hypothetical protein
MVKVDVDPGICGFKTTIRVYSQDLQKARVEIDTECPDIQKMKKEIEEVDAYTEIFAKIGSSPVYNTARKHCKHAACPVPMAILKGIEVASGLALPRDVKIKIDKFDEEEETG